MLCGGDAVHRHPPSSGLGNNTCVQDGHNLGWKLAYAAKGWAGPKLLESYSQERAPVGKQIVLRANQSRLDYGPLNACFRVQGAENPVAAGIARFHDPGPEGVAARKVAQAALDLKQTEYNAQGVKMKSAVRILGCRFPTPAPNLRSGDATVTSTISRRHDPAPKSPMHGSSIGTGCVCRRST